MPKRRPLPALSARTAALEILCLWQADRKPVAPLLDRVAGSLTEQDRSLANKLVQGILRRLDYLDQIIGRFSQHPVAKMKPRTLMALRLGAYQLLFLDRVPESAAVNETVKAFKAQKQPPWLAGFINAVLRNLARKRQALLIAAPPDALPVTEPAWLVKRWQKNYGSETAQEIWRINGSEPNLCLRVNTRLVSRAELQRLFLDQGVASTVGRFGPEALLLQDVGGPITSLPGYQEGLFQVQGEAAQLASHLVGPFFENKRYLDACAGLGGKTGHLAQLLPSGAELWAVEPEARRFRLLPENLARLRLSQQVQLFNGDLAGFAAAATGRFDAILLDAPCSGTGIIRRHPEIRWNRQPEDLPEYQRQQRALLEKAATLLNEQGVIVYATCSIEPEENEFLIESFLHDHSDFSLTDPRPFLPVEATELVDGQGYFRCLPVTGLDGFFAARLGKK